MEELDHVVRSIRSVIFDVQSSGAPGPPSVRRCSRRNRPCSAAARALTNVARHARATHVEVDLWARGGTVTLVGRDNGGGLGSLGSVDGAGSGLGLVNLQSRAERLGGSFAVDRRPEGGTVLRWEVPTDSVSGAAGA